MAKRIPREFVPLDLNLPRDPAIRRAGPDAELLFIRGLIYLKQSDLDGVIPEFDIDVVSVGLRNVRRAVDSLVAQGLWEKRPGGWHVRSWLKWNLSQAEQADKKQKARIGALKTNHSQGRHEEPNEECPLCQGNGEAA